MSGKVRAEPFEEQAPDDLVRAAGVVPAEIDDERGDEPAVEQPHRLPGSRRDVRGEVRREPALDERRVRRQGRHVRRPRRVDVPLVALLTHPQRDPDRGDDRGDRAEHEDERDPAELRGPERADRRAEQQPTHLRGPVQPERLTTPVRRGRIGQEATRGRVVDGRTEAGTRAQQHERHRPGEDERQRPEHAGRDQPDDHQRDPLGAVRQVAEDRLADEASGRPRGDDDAERRQVDPLLDEVERQDGQQATEPQPDDEFGHEERRDATPSFEPGRPSTAEAEAERGVGRVRGGGRRRARRHGTGAAGRRASVAHGVVAGRPDAPGRTGGPLTRKPYTRVSESTESRGAPPHGRHHGRRPRQDLQDPQERGPGARRRGPERPRGHGHGPARPQRRRQDHRRPDPGHAAQAGLRPSDDRRLRPGPPARRHPPGHRPVGAVRGRGREPDREREPVALRAALPAELSRGHAPCEGAPRAVRSRRRRRSGRQDVLRWHAPPTGPRRARSSGGRGCCSSTSRRPASIRAAGSGCGTSSGGSSARA